jgi:hypothetical protein
MLAFDVIIKKKKKKSFPFNTRGHSATTNVKAAP